MILFETRFYCYWLIVLSLLIYFDYTRQRLSHLLCHYGKPKQFQVMTHGYRVWEEWFLSFLWSLKSLRPHMRCCWSCFLVSLAFSHVWLGWGNYWATVNDSELNQHWFQTLFQHWADNHNRHFWLFSKCSMDVCLISISVIWFIVDIFFLYHVKVTIKSHTFQFSLHLFQKAAKATYLSEMITKKSHCSRTLFSTIDSVLNPSVQTFPEIPPLLWENFLCKSTL